ncbi:glycosyltransferase family 4 protein [Mucilaginibacter segetis]|uniref:Glycosyltransferase family 4 protein n=1 Tax=Mucilaginibacter segetis TaxID=2793071 RepID=A0A934PRA7_9SPHI|nr:glycosyltransferase family 4 protein [Mucilaginibacter segetis]MBK0378197.1 glycosyltransferase family 4 protein [Mucilaginibacter segetis]
MTVGLVTPYFPDRKTIDSGIANHCLFLAEGLISAGHKVIVIHIRPRYEDENEEFDEYSINENLIVRTYKVTLTKLTSRLIRSKWAIIDFAVKLKCMLVALKVLNKIIKTFGIDIIETSSYFSLCYFSSFIKIKAPIVVRVSTLFSQMMNEHYPFKSRLMDMIGKMEISFIKRSKYLVTHAKNHAKEVELITRVSSKSFKIIPHGINLSSLNNHTPNPTSALKILYVGRLEYRKGTDILLQAIPVVLKQNPGVQFELIGNDPNKEYQNNFRENNSHEIADKVFFSGKVDNDKLRQAYNDCDIFVAPSRYESFGLIFIEAMSYNKPVIACNVGGVSEIITHRQNGLFARNEDPVDLAKKILQLVNNESLRLKIGNAARQTVEERFTKEMLAKNTVSYYNQILAC